MEIFPGTFYVKSKFSLVYPVNDFKTQLFAGRLVGRKSTGK